MSLIVMSGPIAGVAKLHQDVVCEFFSGTTKGVIPLLSDQLLDCKGSFFYKTSFWSSKTMASISGIFGTFGDIHLGELFSERWTARTVVVEFGTEWNNIYIYIYIYNIYIPPKKAQIGRFPESSDHILF